MTEHEQDRTDGAERDRAERTAYAEDRTALANERTYSAWLRTGLGALAASAAVVRLLGEMMPAALTRAAACLFLAAAVAIFWLAWWRYTHLGRRLRDAQIRRVPEAAALMITMALTAAALLLLAGGAISAGAFG